MGLVYDRPRGPCSGGPQPGLIALRDELLPRFAGARDLGIYNCRNVASTTQLSAHGEGRGWDCGFPGSCDEQGDRLAALLVEHAEALGVQGVSWCRRFWGYGRWEWHEGPGSPHTDHVHVELNWAAARSLTRQRIRSAIDERREPEEEEEEMLFLVRKEGTRGVYVTDGRQVMWPLNKWAQVTDLVEMGAVKSPEVLDLNADAFRAFRKVMRDPGDTIGWEDD